MRKKLRWGVLSTASIGLRKVIPGMQKSLLCSVDAIASRDPGKARAAAGKLGIAKAYGSYEELLADAEIDAIYNPLPNQMHVPWTAKAAEAGKHVLCDKPLAVTVPDARRCVAECRAAGVRLGITFQTRNHDGLAEAAELVHFGGIGKVVLAEVQMSGGRNLPRGWRTDPALAGLGTLNNIGVHAFDMLRYLVGAEVTEVTALVDAEPGFQLDTTALVLLRFSTGTLAYVNANQSVPNGRDDIVLYGTEGRVLGRNLSRPGRDGTLSIITADGTREFPASSHDAYRHTVEAFAAAVLAGRDPSPSGEDGLRSVELTAAIAQAIGQRRVVRLGG